MKIGIVGDLHIAPTPDKRIDNYFETGLNKIEQISKNCDIVIFLGDIFTQPRIEEKYVYSLINHLFYCKNTYNVQFYTIIGNHDVANENESNLINSSLGILQISGAINIIQHEQPINFDNYMFHTSFVNYNKAKNHLSSVSCLPQNFTNVLLLHHEYETGTNAFTYQDLKDLGFNMIFLGHDHKPFEEGRIIYPEYTIYRSGSIMRNRADEYNFTRCLYYFILDTQNKDKPVSCQVIHYEPADKVFKIEAITKQNYKKQKFIESLTEVINKYKNNISIQKRFSIKTILQELGAPERVIVGVRKKYEARQETFN